ncbi:MAG: benzoyl-CoA reductase, bzd-type, subunit Q [Chloroflexi bacterium]|nr:benzoyl-CoA reductase, bzd-type, subunit Q [Chloroflexota bacterium]
MTQEFWRWPESRWTAPDVDCKKAKTITAGVDVGAVSTQAVVLCDDKLFAYANMRTLADSAGSANRAMDRALEGTGLKLKDIDYTVATGYGRKNVSFAQQAVNEILCHVQGARFMFGPSVRTVIDMGGQTAKVIKANEWGRVVEIFVNDKCATGMGRGVELVADLMNVPITEMGDMSLKVEKDPEPVSTTCYVFANTQAIALLRAGVKENEALAAHLFAVAYRLYTLAGRMKVEKELALTGGLAKNTGVAKRLERELGITALTSQYDPQLAGAIGAAVLAKSLLESSSKAAVAAVR